MIVDRNLSFRSVTMNIRRDNLVFFALSLVITLFYRRLNMTQLSLAVAPLTIFGAALTIFLAFRTNTAYDRWWEARTLWGGLVNQSRTLVRQAITFSGVDKPTDAMQGTDDDLLFSPFVHKMAHLQIAFANATRAHLRQQDPLEAVAKYLTAEDRNLLAGVQNVPAALLRRMGIELRRAKQQGLLDTIQLSAMDNTLSDLTDIIGACERIKNTPLPRQYDTVPQFGIYAFSLLLPLGLVSSLGWWTPFICTIITFLFIAIDSIGSNIEDPFENRIHDVPMSTLCRTIEINLCQMVGEKECPAPIEPMHGVLL
ncbi:MAG: bestrophin family ion channel [Armatimonadota bacterium]